MESKIWLVQHILCYRSTNVVNYYMGSERFVKNADRFAGYTFSLFSSKIRSSL